MCGIVGVLSVQSPVDRGLVERMRDALSHRGPDSAGLWRSADGRTVLAHRRLAIIDLSPSGHQPMTAADGQWCIVFNGEIYNFQDLRRELEVKGHRFRSSSDTEVILGAYREWGTECVRRFNGMFAFGLYDSAAKRLFLARDRAGEKPLFYCHTPSKLVFASELKALMADPTFPRCLDLEALDFYLAYGYVAGERCILKGVQKLPQGHAATYALDTDVLRVWRYWQLPEPAPPNNVSPEALTEELESLLLDAVRRQLVADVPVGILLSGGIDSSLVTAMAARVSSGPVKTFTVSFPGHGTYDEAPYARLVASHFGTEHTELVAEPATVEMLPQLARQFDEPIADSSMVPTYLVSKAIRQKAKVALGGDGGDELFGGYTLYPWVLRQQRVRKCVPNVLRQWVSRLAQDLPVGFHGRTYLISFCLEQAQAVAYTGLYFDYRTRLRLAPRLIGESSSPPEADRARYATLGKSTIQQLTAADFATYLPDDILVKVDRASMLTSLEVRAPFLDHRIVAFAFGRVPDKYRANELQGKILPRRLAQRLLPRGLDLNRKQGFSLPLAAWFKGEWGDFMESVLCEAEPTLFNQAEIQRLLAGQRQGYSNTQRLFALTMFELWRREYKVSLTS